MTQGADAILALPTTGDVREAAPEREDYRHALLELLAVIHRDGGQKTQEIGWKLSAEHAMRISAERIAALASPPSTHDMREALEKIARTKFGLQNVLEDHGHDTNAYNYHAMVYWKRLATSYQEIARAAVAGGVE